MDNPFWNGTDFNPIISVDGVALPECPSKYSWELEDLSDANAGRTEDYAMHKNRGAQIRGLKLEWNNLPLQTMQRILKMFNPEYVDVLYIDPLTDAYFGYRRSDIFYTGNRQLAVYNASLNICEKLAFNLVTQYGDSNY